MPKFRKKFVKGSHKSTETKGSDARGYRKEKEERGLRSSSLSYKDDIDSV